jgi:two-component system nitrate/nitrite response regulator NarL
MANPNTAGRNKSVDTSIVPISDSTRQDQASSPKTVRLLLAEDHPVVRRGVALCLAQHPEFEVLGEAADGRETLRKVRDLKPDLVLMDIDLPHINGLELTETLQKEFPQTKVLILSMSDNAEFVPRIIQSGAKGFIHKDAPTEELVRAVETVARGGTFFGPEMARMVLQQIVSRQASPPGQNELTAREREVLAHVARGYSNKEIASHLGIGTRTVETHRENLMRKLNIHSIGGLTRYAVSKGLVMLRDEVVR